MCEICSKLKLKTPEWRQWRRSGVFSFTFKHIWHLFWCFYCWIRTSNTRIYNPSCGLHITRFSVVVAEKRKNFEYIFVLKQANTACRHQMTTAKLFQEHSTLYIFKLVLYFNSITISNQIKYSLAIYIEGIFCRYSMAFRAMLCRFIISYDSLLLNEHVPRTWGS